MQSFKSYLLILLLVPSLSFAKIFGLGLGAFFQTKSVYRGALTWPKPSFMVGPSLILFDKLSIRGPSVSYSHFPRDNPWEFESNFSIVDDGEPLLSLGSHEEDYRNSRKGSYEVSARVKYKFGFMNKFYVGALLARDLKRSEAFYSELQLGAPVFIYTTINYLMGFGELEANRYFYGEEAVSGPSWHEFSLKYVMPFVPWEGIVINSLSYSQILQTENQRAGLVPER